MFPVFKPDGDGSNVLICPGVVVSKNNSERNLHTIDTTQFAREMKEPNVLQVLNDF